MDVYEDNFSKISLTLTAAQVAKENLTKQEGITTELPFNFFVWKYDMPVLCIQMSSELMRQNHTKRFERCFSLLKILRMYLNVSGITFIAEGFVAQDKQIEELHIAFTKKNSRVKECLTVVHCGLEEDNKLPNLCMFALPYAYQLNKKIKWDNLTVFSENVLDIVKAHSYPKMLFDVLNEDSQNFLEVLPKQVKKAIVDNGFYIEEL